MMRNNKKQPERRDAELKWEEFSKTGRIGAYLTYRALAAREDMD